MPPKYRDPDFFTFAELATKLETSQSRIVKDIKTGKIQRFLIDNLNVVGLTGTKKCVIKLMQILNCYAREHLSEGPAKILTIQFAEPVSLNEAQLKMLRQNIKSPSLFKLWLKEYGIDIRKINLVIPLDEALRYERFLKEDPGNSSEPNNYSEDNAETSVIADTEQTPEEYVAELRRIGKSDALIAVFLKEKFPKLKGSECMELIDPIRVQCCWKTKRKDEPRKLFFALHKKGKETLEKGKIMTSSET